MSDQTVRYITLDKPFSAYKSGSTYNDGAIVDEALAKFRANFNFDSSLADKNKDGLADCVTFYLQMPSGLTSNDFRSHQTSAGNINAQSSVVGNKGSARLDNLLMIANTSTGTGMGVFNHEMQHAMGARDYYREAAGGETGSGSGEQHPVGAWDIMASSDVQSSPMAITRQDCGWGDIDFENLPADGSAQSFSLTTWANAQTDGTKRQAVAFKTPGNSSEYFVVEYRNAGTRYSAAPWDYRIPGNGLIIYRVNPSLYEEGNFKSKDYVYIFRRGETGLKDSFSKSYLVPANISKSQGIAKDANGNYLPGVAGSTDMTKGITDGALVYSDGSNSGLKITVTEESTDGATFTIEGANYQTMNFWDTVADKDGSTPFDSKKVNSCSTATDGANIFMLAEETKEVQYDTVQTNAVYQWNGSAWSTLPALPSAVSQPSIACVNGAVFVGGVSNAGSIKAFKWTPGSSSWTTLTSPNISLSECSLFASQNSLYLTASTGDAVRVYALNGSGFSQVGKDIAGQSSSSNLTKPTVFDMGSSTGLAVSDIFGTKKTTIYQLSGNAWNAAKTVDFAAGAISAASVNGTSYIMMADNNGGHTPMLFCYSDAESKTLTLDALSHCRNPGNLVACSHSLLYTTTNDGKLTVVQASLDDLETWEAVGQPVLSPAESGSLTGIGDKAYCAAATSDGKRAYLKTTTLSDTVIDPSNPPDPIDPGDGSGSGSEGGTDSGSGGNSGSGGGSGSTEGGDSGSGPSSGGSTEGGSGSGSGSGGASGSESGSTPTEGSSGSDDSSATTPSGGSFATGSTDSSANSAAGKPSAQTVTTSKSACSLMFGKAAKIGAKAKTAISYKTSNKKVATVDKNGKIVAKGTGTCKATVSAKATGSYKAASKAVTVIVSPKAVSLSKVMAGKKSFKASWKKSPAASAGGYQVRYATAKSMKGAKTAIAKSCKATSRTVKKLKGAKKYYVQVRAYKKVSGKTYYSAWSAKKSVETKK